MITARQDSLSESTRLVSRPATSWWLDAVFYELSVKAFFDSNGDGIGDFPGLTQKLEYLSELGVNALRLLPFFPSPWRDDGYDVSDFRAVHPALGTIDDFRKFLGEAHRRDLRVVIEVVVNHTSDAHPWFQAAREAPPGSPLRDFYVWSDEPDRFREVEVRFRDAEGSNWNYDPIAKAYYWHRFFSHQPELNYDNPQVRDEMLRVLRFWADLGVDGLCLNGASYLVEREGTASEHLPETHLALKTFRQALEADHPDLMLEAGVNARPSEAHSYFADGDECNVVPNFALAQRLFQAVRQEDRHPIAELIGQTPAPPRGCQWLTLLRNHDELTLSLATDEERDYLFREYAADPRLRRYTGVLRRLAPILENDRRRIELLFGLIFSLPGAPVIYYGDEIGLGDNPRLSGRQGLRTPMPWTSERNAGFSAADPAELDTPPVADSVFGHQAANVQKERRDPSSLFHWLRRQIGFRKRSRALSRGEIELLDLANRKVLAIVRRFEDDTILVVANLSRMTQPASIDLSAFHGLFPVETSGGEPFPAIDRSPYLFTLAPYALHSFRLSKAGEEITGQRAPVPVEEIATLPEIEFAALWTDLPNDPAWEKLERTVLPAYLRSQRWFGGKARTIETVRLLDWGPFPLEGSAAFLALLEVTFAGGLRDRYFFPFAVSAGHAATRLIETKRKFVVAQLIGPSGSALLHDALADENICRKLLAAIGNGENFRLHNGTVQSGATSAFEAVLGAGDSLPVTLGPATSSNTLVFFGRRLLLKLFRRLEAGVNPDFEIGQFLTETRRFARIPRVAGNMEYHPSDSDATTLVILQSLVSNQGDGWHHAVDEVGRYYDRAASRMVGPDPVAPDPRPPAELAGAPPPPALIEVIDGYLRAAAKLGRRTAEMHAALADPSGGPDFAPEPLGDDDHFALREELRNQAERVFPAIAENIDRLPIETRADAERLLADGPRRIEDLSNAPSSMRTGMKTRIHGDYHLGQVLWVDQDYVILDFEGEPTRPISERRAKFSPIRDVAGMLRSYHYAAYAGLFRFTEHRPDDFAHLVPWAESWQQWVSAAFLRSYLSIAQESEFLPRDNAQFALLLDRFMLAKALYELSYELDNRPDWVRIPLGGVSALLGFGTERPPVRRHWERQMTGARPENATRG